MALKKRWAGWDLLAAVRPRVVVAWRTVLDHVGWLLRKVHGEHGRIIIPSVLTG